MALPKLTHPRYTMKLYKSDEKIAYRGFTNREQKPLLQIKHEIDSADPSVELSKDVTGRTFESLVQVLEQCTFGEVNIRDLKIYDFEMLFIKIRSVSQDSSPTMHYEYEYFDKDDVEKKEPLTGNFSITVDLDTLELSVPDEDVSDTIQLDENLFLKLRYPTLGDIERASERASDANDLNGELRSAIEMVYDAEDTYPLDNQTKEEVDELINDLDSKTMAKIQKFIQNVPRLRHEHTVTLLDGRKETITFEGITDFFD